ncbi:MAG: FtsQ-type POTRA domain-containing protein, partial [Eggerthellaceae bacterium]|nr:FtsQ-type POTRA domain-containing protein [Eggerthellaceae bacterium]
MASNYRPRLGSSGSNRPPVVVRGSGSRTTKRSSGKANLSSGSSAGSYRVVPGGRPSSGRSASSRSSRPSSPRTDAQYRGGRAPSAANRSRSVGAGRSARQPHLSSVRIGDLQAERIERANLKYRNALIRFGVVAVLLLLLLLGGTVLYASNAFAIEDVRIEGVEHLTEAEMEALAKVPDTTLLRVDVEAIEANLLRDAWVQEVRIKRQFPSTLHIVITERAVTAVVDVPTASATSTQPWAIASDGMWLMAIPDQDSELGQAISQQIYEDAANVLHITDVPY